MTLAATAYQTGHLQSRAELVLDAPRLQNAYQDGRRRWRQDIEALGIVSRVKLGRGPNDHGKR